MKKIEKVYITHGARPMNTTKSYYISAIGKNYQEYHMSKFMHDGEGYAVDWFIGELGVEAEKIYVNGKLYRDNTANEDER